MFGTRLKEIRKKRGYTQVSLAEALGVSKGTVAMWETKKRTPGFDTLCEISSMLDVRTDFLLGQSDDDSPIKRTDKQIEQLGIWELESAFTDIFKMYLSLDDFGKSAVDGLIKAELLRCHEQSSVADTSGVKLSLKLN